MTRALRSLAILAALAAGCASEPPDEIVQNTARYQSVVELPAPDVTGPISLEQALRDRRSAREFSDREPALQTIGQLFWAGQGTTDDEGRRTAPSAGGTYPLELYAVTGSRLMHYLPIGHRTEERADAATLSSLGDAAFGQEFVGEAPLVLVITGDPSRTEQKYGAVAVDLMNREAGHAAQNVLLQATTLGLAAVPVGGFDPEAVAQLLALPPGESVLYLIPVGESPDGARD
jgi:SagB-type dehydrogenase family enzyme